MSEFCEGKHIIGKKGYRRIKSMQYLPMPTIIIPYQVQTYTDQYLSKSPPPLFHTESLQ